MPRIRRIVRWFGLVVCVAIAVAWGVSTGRDIGYGDHSYSVSVTSGAVKYVYGPSVVARSWFCQPEDSCLFWWPRYDPYGVMYLKPPVPLYVFIVPLWIPLVAVAIPTVIAWRRDRRPKPGRCRCGYDLTANVSGRCPECGRAT